MGFLQRLFGSAPAAPVDDTALFRQRVSDHRSRMMSAGSAHATFLREYLSDEVLSMLAPMAAEKMALTQSDSDEHSFMIAKSPVCYVVCTIPVELPQGAGWFERRYGGYGELLARCWNSDIYRSSGCQVLCHITYGRTKSGAWTNITVFPMRSTSFTFDPILAIDLLSAAEKNAAGNKRRRVPHDDG
jgi:hypothetical protein